MWGNMLIVQIDLITTCNKQASKWPWLTGAWPSFKPSPEALGLEEEEPRGLAAILCRR